MSDIPGRGFQRGLAPFFEDLPRDVVLHLCSLLPPRVGRLVCRGSRDAVDASVVEELDLRWRGDGGGPPSLDGALSLLNGRLPRLSRVAFVEPERQGGQQRAAGLCALLTALRERGDVAARGGGGMHAPLGLRSLSVASMSPIDATTRGHLAAVMRTHADALERLDARLSVFHVSDGGSSSSSSFCGALGALARLRSLSIGALDGASMRLAAGAIAALPALERLEVEVVSAVDGSHLWTALSSTPAKFRALRDLTVRSFFSHPLDLRLELGHELPLSLPSLTSLDVATIGPCVSHVRLSESESEPDRDPEMTGFRTPGRALGFVGCPDRLLSFFFGRHPDRLSSDESDMIGMFSTCATIQIHVHVNFQQSVHAVCCTSRCGARTAVKAAVSAAISAVSGADRVEMGVDRVSRSTRVVVDGSAAAADSMASTIAGWPASSSSTSEPRGASARPIAPGMPVPVLVHLHAPVPVKQESLREDSMGRPRSSSARSQSGPRTTSRRASLDAGAGRRGQRNIALAVAQGEGGDRVSECAARRVSPAMSLGRPSDVAWLPGHDRTVSEASCGSLMRTSSAKRPCRASEDGGVQESSVSEGSEPGCCSSAGASRFAFRTRSSGRRIACGVAGAGGHCVQYGSLSTSRRVSAVSGASAASARPASPPTRFQPARLLSRRLRSAVS